MTRDDILRMAREAGMPETETEGVFLVNSDDLGRILAAEREQCAKVAKALSDKCAFGHNGNEVDTADEIEAAIRARGKT